MGLLQVDREEEFNQQNAIYPACLYFNLSILTKVKSKEWRSKHVQ